MAVKIRLARHGKKGLAFYHIVAADSRAPRDGKFIEKLGTFDPTKNPAIIELNFEKTLEWLQNGALPSDTARTILRKEGILYMKHLLTGVRKGSFDRTVADERFAEWKAKEEHSVSSIKNKLLTDKEKDLSKRLEAETKYNKARIAKIAKKNTPEVVEEEISEAAEESQAPETAAE